MGGFSESSGRMTLAKGKAEAQPRLAAQGSVPRAVVKGKRGDWDLGDGHAAGDEARLFRARHDEYVALWIRGEYMIETKGAAATVEGFSRILA